MNFKNPINDIIVSIISNLVVSIILASMVDLSPFVVHKAFIIAAVVAIEIVIVKKSWSSIVHFKWWYTYRQSVHIVEICSNNKIKQTEKICPAKCNKDFNSKITGELIWNDVQVENLMFDCEDQAVITCTTIDINGNKLEYKNGTIHFHDKFVGIANYVVEFPFNKCADVSFSAEMYYDKNTAPEFFVDIERPVKELVIEVKVHKGVQINNVRKKIIPLFGEYKSSSQKNKAVLIDSRDEIEGKVYTFKIKNPLLFHRYTICWEWIK